MLKNLLLTTLRNFRKKSVFTAINVIGLALGMATCLIIALYVQYDLSYDSFQNDQVYRVVLNRVYPEREVDYAFIPHSISPQMVEDFPEVIGQARLFKIFGNINFQNGEDTYSEENVVFADSSVFDIISIPLLKGDPNNALRNPNSIILSESTATKIFGSTDVIGKMLESPNGSYAVSAVAYDYPKNSHIIFNYIIPMHSLDFFNQTNWTGFSALSYIKVKEGTDYLALEKKFPDLIRQYADGEIKARNGISFDEYIAAGNGYNYTLQPIKSIHLHSKLEGEMKPNGNISHVYIFSIVAVFILIIASINFMNLSTARSTERGKEVGIRKVLGSTKQHLVAQFLTEAILITILGAISALIIAYFALPFFNQIAQRPLSLSILLDPFTALTILFIIAVIGIISGLYPAFFISSFSPLRVMKGELKTSSSGIGLRNTLVVVQFAISIALISVTMVVYEQMSYLLHKSLGFTKDHVVVADNAFALNNTPNEINWERFKTFKTQISQIENVESVSYTSAMPGDLLPGYLIRVPGTGKESMMARNITFDDEMLETLQMKLTEGRFFAPEFNDSLNMILNQSAVQKLGISNPIGSKIINIDNDNRLVEYTIIGVIEDIHFQSLHVGMEPIAITSNQSPEAFYNKMVVRISPDNIGATLAELEQTWDQFAPNSPFKHYFLDEQLARFYESEKSTMALFSLFTGLAMVIACIGLLGLSAFVINQRIKEIGVRKVLGASTVSIMWLLSTSFAKLIGIAALIAIPAAYFWVNSWLENFAYSISIPWVFFGLAALVALLIGLLTISLQSIKTASMNPVKSLRDE